MHFTINVIQLEFKMRLWFEYDVSLTAMYLCHISHKIVLRLVHQHEVRGTRDKTIGVGVICYNKTPKWTIFKLS